LPPTVNDISKINYESTYGFEFNVSDLIPGMVIDVSATFVATTINLISKRMKWKTAKVLFDRLTFRRWLEN
jgi:hypothetical protein